MKCSNCGKEIDGGARFCPYCGKEQVKELRCAHCGTSLRPEAKFCPNCGSPVGGQSNLGDSAVRINAAETSTQVHQSSPAGAPNRVEAPKKAGQSKFGRWIWIVLLLLAVSAGLWYASTKFIGKNSGSGDTVTTTDDDQSHFVDEMMDDLFICEDGFMGISVYDTVGNVASRMAALDEANFNANPQDYQYAASLNAFPRVEDVPVAVAAIFTEAVAEPVYAGYDANETPSGYHFKEISPKYIYFVIDRNRLDGHLEELYSAIAAKARGLGDMVAQNDNAIVTQRNGIAYIVVNAGGVLAFYVGYINVNSVTIAPFQGATESNSVALSELSVDAS